MTTPICDFARRYAERHALRLHMPGHKGCGFLGVEQWDITEIDGADSLYEAAGIIRESEDNASALFGAPTFYSTEGSSQCIRAMLYLVALHAKKQGKRPRILAGRNAHKTF
ncbi:MAG: amino acid decarboxylase, partial [Oscillospiraceae bacterium]|nr:amino acid decarboxylase [Oscillospiraceae bacterium]